MFHETYVMLFKAIIAPAATWRTVALSHHEIGCQQEDISLLSLALRLSAFTLYIVSHSQPPEPRGRNVEAVQA